MSTDAPKTKSTNFIRQIIDEDLASGRHTQVVTRFPPEPNGYLHVGHAKAISVDFGIARDYGGVCHLRMDDTNPTAEDPEYAAAIERDIRWLGYDWGEHLYHASDYFEQLYGYAMELVEAGLAYVDHQDIDAIRTNRGTLTEAGTPSPYRDRSVAENRALLAQMRAGDFPDGACVLRAKIDMTAANLKLRDPLLYRIRHVPHDRTGDAWCIYPMYDFAHPLSDAIEGITHSICTLEFENNRDIYDWLIEHTSVAATPRQYEFARLNLSYTVTSKRVLLQLVNDGKVRGWDDPRMPTIAGMRRRGITPEAIRALCDETGVVKSNSLIDFSKLDFLVRDDLNPQVPRVMAVVDALKVVITNYPPSTGEGPGEVLDAPLYPHDVPLEGSRPVPFSRELYIERSDFEESPPKGYYRLAPGHEVRLRYAYYVRCESVVKDASGRVTEVHCTYDPATRGGTAPDGRKVAGTIQWLSAAHAVPAELRLYDRLFTAARPGSTTGDVLDDVNPEGLIVAQGFVEPSIADDAPGTRYQFERQGYFIADAVDSKPGALVYNRIVPLRDSWANHKQSAVAEAQESDEADAARETASTAPAAARKADTRPTKKTRAQVRAEARDADPTLMAKYTEYLAAGRSEDDADVLTEDHALAAFYDAAVAAHDPESVTRWVINELLGAIKETPVAELPFDGARFAALVALVDADTLSNRAAKAVLEAMLATGEAPTVLMERLGLRQLDDDDALAATVAEVIAANADQVARYRDGNPQLLGFFIGQVMKRTGGKANPKTTRDLVTAALA